MNITVPWSGISGNSFNCSIINWIYFVNYYSQLQRSIRIVALIRMRRESLPNSFESNPENIVFIMMSLLLFYATFAFSHRCHQTSCDARCTKTLNVWRTNLASCQFLSSHKPLHPPSTINSRHRAYPNIFNMAADHGIARIGVGFPLI